MTTLAEQIIVVGVENRPPILKKSMYDSWPSRIHLFIKGKKHGRMMLDLVDNGLLGEILCEYYWRFSQLVNDMHTIGMTMQQVQVNTKSTLVTQQSHAEFPQLDSGLAVPRFQQGKDPIERINKPMAFLSAVASRMVESLFNKFKEDKIRVMVVQEIEELLLLQREMLQLVHQELRSVRTIKEKGIKCCDFVIDDDEILIWEEKSRSKMLDKQNDPISIEKKIKISLIGYSKLNKIKEDFGKCFVTKKELSAEQAFWLKHSSLYESPVTLHTPIRIKSPSEITKHDIEPISPRHKKSKDAHEVYIEKTIEYTDTLRGFVERARTQITPKKIVHLKETTPKSVETPKPKIKVYSRRPKHIKSVGSSKKAKIVESIIANNSEPTHLWGSNATDVSSSSLVNKSKFLGTVRFENDQVAKIMGYGDYQQGNVIISRVYYVERLRHNLFSAGQFCDVDLEVPFRKNTCFIRNLEACALGKSKKSSHQPKAEDTNQEKLYLLHMDLCGPMHVERINGKNEDLGKLNAKVDIGPGLQVMTLATSCSGLVPNIIPQQPFNLSKRDDRDTLFRHLLDEYFNHSTIVVSTVSVAAAPRALDIDDSHVSISINQDAPSPKSLSSNSQERERERERVASVATNATQSNRKLYEIFAATLFISPAYTQTEVRQFCDTLIQHMESVKKSIDERAQLKREYDRRVIKRLMQTQESKVDSSKTLDVTECSETKSDKHDSRSSSGNYLTHVVDANIGSVNDQVPFDEFDEYFNSPPCAVSPDLVAVAAPRPVDLADSPTSTTIDQDVPSANPTSEETTLQGVIPSNLHHLNQSVDTLTKLTKNHPLDNVIGNSSRPVSTRSQLQEHAIWCCFDVNDNPIPFGGKCSS
nr:integrase, catalytic region, zinc finger, CCHC-type, peptidase aspartic, catalytic [Tanacetum cinerariifolium]